MDLQMLVVAGGRERTETEFAALFARAGLRLTRVVATPTPFAILEAVRGFMEGGYPDIRVSRRSGRFETPTNVQEGAPSPELASSSPNPASTSPRRSRPLARVGAGGRDRDLGPCPVREGDQLQGAAGVGPPAARLDHDVRRQDPPRWRSGPPAGRAGPGVDQASAREASGPPPAARAAGWLPRARRAR